MELMLDGFVGFRQNSSCGSQKIRGNRSKSVEIRKQPTASRFVDVCHLLPRAQICVRLSSGATIIVFRFGPNSYHLFRTSNWQI